MSRTKLLVSLASAIALLFLGAAIGLRGAEQEKEDVEWYVRPLKSEKTSNELFELLGVDSAGFEFRLPPGKKARFLAVARDADGKVIESLSYSHEFTPRGPEEINEGEFRISRIDPGALVEGYKGKIRWVVSMRRNGGNAGVQQWEKNHFAGNNTVPGWSAPQEISSPELGKQYRLSRMEAYPNGLNSISDDSPTVFDFQLSFKLAERGDSFWGSSGHRPYRDN